MNLTKMERYLPVNLLGTGPRLMKKRIYRGAVSQRLRNTAIVQTSAPSPKTFLLRKISSDKQSNTIARHQSPQSTESAGKALKCIYSGIT